jgi:phosphomannomutase / phosphoglucomutase
MQKSIFRTYDIRGKVGSELILKDAYELGCALVSCFKRKMPDLKTIALAMDGRVHSQIIKDAIEKAFLDAGINVIFIGLCPTPVLYFSQYHLNVQAGIMITASHNPSDYNGIKMVVNKQPFFGDEIQNIYETFLNKDFIKSEQKGIVTSYDLIKEYISFLVEEFSHLLGTTRNLIFDCGNGTASTVIPELIKQMEWHSAQLLCSDITQTDHKHEADPSVKDNMQDLTEAVNKRYEALGIAFDGDADRMGAISEDGQFVSGDTLLACYAQQILKKIPGATIVCDGKCSSGLKEIITKAGGNLTISKTGHAFIKQAIQKSKAVFAGELSCHFFFNDRYFGYDDGIYAALRLIEILELTQQRLIDLVADFPYRISSPELRIECPDGKGVEIVEAAKKYFSQQKDLQMSTLDGVRIEKTSGWGLLRSSNTQSMVCLRLEAESDEGLADIKRDFMNALSLSYTKEDLERKITW